MKLYQKVTTTHKWNVTFHAEADQTPIFGLRMSNRRLSTCSWSLFMADCSSIFTFIRYSSYRQRNLFLAERHACCCSFPSWSLWECSVWCEAVLSTLSASCFTLMVESCTFKNQYRSLRRDETETTLITSIYTRVFLAPKSMKHASCHIQNTLVSESVVNVNN